MQLPTCTSAAQMSRCGFSEEIFVFLERAHLCSEKSLISGLLIKLLRESSDRTISQVQLGMQDARRGVAYWDPEINILQAGQFIPF